MDFKTIIVELGNIAREAAANRIDKMIGYQIEHHNGVLESHLEIVMLVALIVEGVARDIHVDPITPSVDQEFRKILLFRDTDSPAFCSVAAQLPLREYRVDFCMCFYGDVRVVVECDGHDYHERTKEQALRDRSRDRALQADGFQVLRFTGREIWRDPLKCAGEVFDAADSELKRRRERDDA